MQMHDGEDEYAMRFDAVQQTVRETVNETSADLRFDFRPQCWIGKGVLNGDVDFTGEVQSETRFAIFVVDDTFHELFICFRVEGEVHSANRR